MTFWQIHITINHAQVVGKTVADAIKELQELPMEELVPNRVKKFLSMTRDVEIFQPDHIPEEKQV